MIWDKAQDLGRLIGQSAEYQALRRAESSLREDKETVAKRILRLREGAVEHGIPIVPKIGRVTFDDAAADVVNDYIVNHRRSLDGFQALELCLPFAAPGKGTLQYQLERLARIDDARIDRQAGTLQGKAPGALGQPDLVAHQSHQVFGVAAVVDRKRLIQANTP